MTRPTYRVPVPGTGRYPPHLRGARPARWIMLVMLLAAAGLVIYDYTRPDPAYTPVSPGASGDVVVEPGTGSAGFVFAGGTGPMLGTGGVVQTFRVAVQADLGIGADDFAAAVDTILGDPRSWIASGELRLQRVQTPFSDFTIYLASPVVSEQLCRVDGLETEQFTSCRLHDGRVVINSERWLTAVPDYGAPLEVYQAYAINHEVGHQLGHGHEACPAAGQPAPVMQQQTYGLQGCVANGWPYVDGALYTGPPVA